MVVWEDVIVIGERFFGVEVMMFYGWFVFKVVGKFLCSLWQNLDVFVFCVFDVFD